ncbi:hypothetical protein [Streptomyces sp. NPDC006638]|uniref:hypothetical protein n=1 Tax=Streptomyces sp. NPDC006638 TaxID=3157183 RepID=UPI0033A2E281
MQNETYKGRKLTTLKGKEYGYVQHFVNGVNLGRHQGDEGAVQAPIKPESDFVGGEAPISNAVRPLDADKATPDGTLYADGASVVVTWGETQLTGTAIGVREDGGSVYQMVDFDNGNVDGVFPGDVRRVVPIEDAIRTDERVSFVIRRTTIHATATGRVDDHGRIGIVVDGDRTGQVRYISREHLTKLVPDMDALHAEARSLIRLKTRETD